MKNKKPATVWTGALAFTASLAASGAVAQDRPNIMLIVADDLGYTDIGVMGSEIDTPVLDDLAAAGTLFTDLMVTPQCSSTRSMLLSGTDSHLAGLGQMAEWKKSPNQEGQPGYIGYLNDDVVSVATTLGEAGYDTFMVGKWHLGRDIGYGPHNRGFDHSFAMEVGVASHFDTRKGYTPSEPLAPYIEDGNAVLELPEGFYSTDFYTDKMIEYLDTESENPFFAYVAYTSPHWPLQAPDDWLDKYAGRYDEGYEVQKVRRSESLRDKGLFPAEAEIGPFIPGGGQRPWDSLTDEEKAISSRSMEIHAAMVANMDWNIGRLLDYLKETGRYDNTLVLFMSDNGADQGNPTNIWNRYGEEAKAEWSATYDWSLENMGRPNSYVSFQEWAQGSNGPLRHFKGVTSEGGIRSMFIAKPVGGMPAGNVSDAFITVMDLAPTFLELAGAEHPAEWNGHPVYPHKGKSLLPLVDGSAEQLHDADYIAGVEINQKQAVRKGDWKIVWLKDGPFKSESWQLFNLAEDPGETTDLAASDPEKLEEMIAAWNSYVEDSHLILAPWPPTE